MCNPVAIAASTMAVQSIAGGANASAQHAAAKQNQKIGGELAHDDALRQYGALAEARSQSREADADALFQVSKDAIAAGASARTAGLEAGGAGGSLNAYLNEFVKSRLESARINQRNQEFADAQFLRESEGIREQEHRTLISLMPGPKAQDPLASLVGWSLNTSLNLGSFGLFGKGPL